MVDTWRCFVAVELPDVGKQKVRGEIDALRRVGAQLGWVRDDQLHVTLKFLGEVEVEAIDALREALRPVAAASGPLQLRLEGMGRFPRRGPPRVFWVGLAGETEELGALAAAVEESCTALGYEAEQRPFSPHVTLGRVKGPRHLRELEAKAAERGDKMGEPMPAVTRLRLYRSELRPEGPHYSVIEEFELGSSS